ncbi:MAG: hypothetical protein WC184_11615 [Acidimicrobiia bacterium]
MPRLEAVLETVPSEHVVRVALKVLGSTAPTHHIINNRVITVDTVKLFPRLFAPAQVTQRLVSVTNDPAIVSHVVGELEDRRSSVLYAVMGRWRLPIDLATLLVKHAPPKSLDILLEDPEYFVGVQHHLNRLTDKQLVRWLVRGGHRFLDNTQLVGVLQRPLSLPVTAVLEARPTIVEQIALEGHSTLLPSVAAVASAELLSAVMERLRSVQDSGIVVASAQSLVWRSDTPPEVYDWARQQLLNLSDSTPPLGAHRPLVDVGLGDVTDPDLVLLHCELFRNPPRNLFPTVVTQIVRNEKLWASQDIRRFVALWCHPALPAKYSWIEPDVLTKISGLAHDEQLPYQVRSRTNFGDYHTLEPDLSDIKLVPTLKTPETLVEHDGNVTDFTHHKPQQRSESLHIDPATVVPAWELGRWLIQQLGDGTDPTSETYWENLFRLFPSWERTYGELIQSVKRISR